MAGVWSTDTDQQVVLLGEIRGDVSLALAAVLSADQDVDEWLPSTPVEPKTSRGSGDDVLWSAAVGVDDDVGDWFSESTCSSVGSPAASS